MKTKDLPSIVPHSQDSWLMKFSRRGLLFISFIGPTSPLSNNPFFPSGVFSPTPPPTWIHGCWTLLHLSNLNSLCNVTLLPGLHTHPVSHLALLQPKSPPPSHDLTSLLQGRSPRMPSQHAHSQLPSHFHALSHSWEGILKCIHMICAMPRDTSKVSALPEAGVPTRDTVSIKETRLVNKGGHMPRSLVYSLVNFY